MNTSLFQNLLLTTALGGGIAAAPSVYRALTDRSREQGQSGIGGKAVGEITDKDIAQLKKLQEATQGAAAQQYQTMSPLVNQNLDRAMQRTMQLNQQQGQITGGLAQQKYAYQMAGGAQQMGGQVLNSMLANANPYATSAFTPGVNMSL